MCYNGVMYPLFPARLAVSDIKECITCGDNTYGQLGYQSRIGARIPGVVTALRGKAVERVACGDFFTVACTTGEVSCSIGYALYTTLVARMV